ncbi:hypothetical protein DPMN_194795 [Dreissena polymorpha]|uniref:Uncharacterized protein n=1 Tax=Dreissena polymorpha TaxID=45954 RepID=A0A9D3Y4W7_DREPO|nr:hypothetical protein DPMN_194795 [Dreissena polymorpha]
MALTRIVDVFVFHFSRVFSPSDVDGASGIFPKNSDYHDRSRLTTPSCDHSPGNLLLERDEWSVGGRRASVDHTKPTTVGFCSFSLNRTQVGETESDWMNYNTHWTATVLANYQQNVFSYK